MKKIPFFLVLAISFFISFFAKAGGEYHLVGARTAALGFSSVSLSDRWSAFNNQGGLAFLKETSAGIYHENRYLVKELGLSAVCFNMPFQEGMMALSVSYLGFDAWNESRFGLAYARTFGDKFAIGAQLDYGLIKQAENYNTLDFITFEIGMIVRLSDKLMLGVHTYNPINAGVSEYTNEKNPATFRLGTSYKASGKFLFICEVEKSTDAHPLLKAGIEYEIFPLVHLRTGVASNPALWSFGAGFGLGKFTIDISTSNHYLLGFSPQASLSYNFK